MNGFWKALALCAGVVTFHTASIASIRVQPMSYDLATSGTGTTQDLRVENTSDQPMPVEIIVHRREILPDGSERRTAAEEDFLVFPPQAIVPPNSFQTFRVQYIGDPQIAATKLYLITVSQLPVNTTGEASRGMQFLFNLGTLAAVSPRDSRPEMEVLEVRPAATAGMVEIRIRNAGNRYARLRNGIWTLRSGDGTVVVVDDRAVRGAIRQGLIEPGTERIIALPVDAGFRREGATATFQLRDLNAE
jgi:fimbrial chaperone protein